jgi:hypothetical protein
MWKPKQPTILKTQARWEKNFSFALELFDLTEDGAKNDKPI